MSWYFWVAIGTWACAISATVCSIAVVWLVTQNKRAHKDAMAMLQRLGDTHMMAIEVLSTDLERLKQRVLDLETDAL